MSSEKTSFFEVPKSTWWRWPLIPFFGILVTTVGSIAAGFMAGLLVPISAFFGVKMSPEYWSDYVLSPIGGASIGFCFTIGCAWGAPRHKRETAGWTAAILLALLLALLFQDLPKQPQPVGDILSKLAAIPACFMVPFLPLDRKQKPSEEEAAFIPLDDPSPVDPRP